MEENKDRLIRISIFVGFIVIVIILIWSFVSDTINKYNESKKVIIESETEISSYVLDNPGTIDSQIKNSTLVKSYTTYYTIQNAYNNYIQALIDEKYEETYAIVTQDIKSKYDKNTYIEKIKEYTQKNFKTSNNIDGATYEMGDNLKSLYYIKKNTYIGEIKNSSNEIIKLGIVLDTSNNTYRIFYIEI